MRNLTNLSRRLAIDDVLFVIALAIPTFVAAARYFESDREMTALPKAQEPPTTLIAKAGIAEGKRMVQDPTWGAQPGTARGSRTTP